MSRERAPNISYMIVNLVRKRISTEYVTASDTEVADALDVSRQLVSGYKNGRDVMSVETLDRAQRILELPRDELADYALVLLEAAKPEAKAVWAAHRWMMNQARRLPSILLAGLTLIGMGALPDQSARAGTGGGASESVYYGK